MPQVNTAGRAIDTADLGVTLMHEHVFVLSPEILQNYPEKWGDEARREADAIRRLNELKSRGVDSIVDLTVIGLGRYIPRIARIAAHGSLMGARGNSGVILSQIFRGFAKAVEGKTELAPAELAAAFEEAANAAYRAVLKPTEGTILTVAREAGRAASGAAAEPKATVTSVIKAAAEGARRAVEKTPSQLQILRDAGVVDAGDFGLQVMIEGMLRSFEEGELDLSKITIRSSAQQAMELPEEGWGYCTEFLIAGEGMDVEHIRDQIAALGDSVLVVGEPELVKVHVHTDDPPRVIGVASQFGRLEKLNVGDMSTQHRRILEESQPNGSTGGAAQKRANNVGIAAVVSGSGLVEILRGLGVDAIVEGGQTMNPSTGDLVAAVDGLPYDEVILLPNNKNVVLAAREAMHKAIDDLGRPARISLFGECCLRKTSHEVFYAGTECSLSLGYRMRHELFQFSRLPRDVGVRESFWWTYLGAFIGGTWMMLVGTLAAAAAPGLDVAAAMEYAADQALAGLGKVLLLSALLGLVTISALNFYGASLTLLSVADTVQPLRCTVGKRVASLAVAFVASCAIALSSSSDFMGRFEDYLAVLLYLFTPWTAINLIDFYVVRKGHYSIREIFNPAGMYGRWNWRGLIAYLGGFVAMIPFFSTGMYTGVVARALGGADIAMLIGLPVSAGIYLALCRSVDLEYDRRRAASADAGLDPDDASAARAV